MYKYSVNKTAAQLKMGKIQKLIFDLFDQCYAMLSHFSHVRLCATPQTAAHQAPQSLGFSRQEHWSELPFPSPMHESESESEVAQSCPTPSDPMYCSLPGSSVHGICQARVLEWVATAFPSYKDQICKIRASVLITQRIGLPPKYKRTPTPIHLCWNVFSLPLGTFTLGDKSKIIPSDSEYQLPIWPNFFLSFFL